MSLLKKQNEWRFEGHTFNVELGMFSVAYAGICSKLALKTYAEGDDYLGCFVEDRYRKFDWNEISLAVRERDHMVDIQLAAIKMIKRKVELNAENSNG